MGRFGRAYDYCGIICLAVPGITEVTVAIAYGVILLVSGIADIVIFAVWGPQMLGAGWLLLDGILTILLSLFLIWGSPPLPFRIFSECGSCSRA